jgi:hypothetical protein
MLNFSLVFGLREERARAGYRSWPTASAATVESVERRSVSFSDAGTRPTCSATPAFPYGGHEIAGLSEFLAASTGTLRGSR